MTKNTDIYEMNQANHMRWQPRPMTEEELAYLSAWNKIKGFIKRGFKFDEKKKFKCPFNPYHYTNLIILPSGESYIERGSHGWGCSDFVDNPDDFSEGDYGKFNQENPSAKLSSVTYAMIKTVVDSWPKLKEAIINLDSLIKSIKNFHI